MATDLRRAGLELGGARAVRGGLRGVDPSYAVPPLPRPGVPVTVVTTPLPYGARFRVHPDVRITETVYPDGKIVGGMREPTTENCREAAEQGYPPTPAGCWLSLVTHEIAHSVCAATLHGSYSIALRDAAGDPQPYALRLAEEGVVLCVERFLNTGEVRWPLEPYRAHLDPWSSAIRAAVRACGVE